MKESFPQLKGTIFCLNRPRMCRKIVLYIHLKVTSSIQSAAFNSDLLTCVFSPSLVFLILVMDKLDSVACSSICRVAGTVRFQQLDVVSRRFFTIEVVDEYLGSGA